MFKTWFENLVKYTNNYNNETEFVLNCFAGFIDLDFARKTYTRKWEIKKMAKRYKIKQAEPRWKDVKIDYIRSAYDYEKYMMDNHGYERKILMGSIGTGTKTHMFSTVCRIEGDIIYIANCMSLCGSAKWSSFLNINLNQDIKCNCERCNKGV